MVLGKALLSRYLSGAGECNAAAHAVGSIVSQAATSNACTVALLGINTVAFARNGWRHARCRIDAVSLCSQPGGVVNARCVNVGTENTQW